MTDQNVEEPGRVFLIDGGRYPLPDVAGLTMNERRVMFDLSGLVGEDFIQRDDETEDERDERVEKLTRHPGFFECLMHIAYQRGNPQLKRPKVQEVIDRTVFADAVAEWKEDLGEEEAENPPAVGSTSEPDGSSPRSSSDSNGSSGSDSPNGSDAPDEIPANTGASPSATSSPASRETTSEISPQPIS